MSQIVCQEVDVQHLNCQFTMDFETRFEDIFLMVIPQWIIYPNGDIKEKDIILQEVLTVFNILPKKKQTGHHCPKRFVT